jgi:hypothetical protein
MSDTLDSAQKSRREFLEKAGKLAVYTPPVIMMLSYPGTEAIASGGSQPPKPPKPPKLPKLPKLPK